MERFNHIMRVLSAVCVLIIAAILCWECIDIYMTSKCDRLVNDSGIFRLDNIAARFEACKAPLTACMLLIGVSIVLDYAASGKAPEAEKHDDRMNLPGVHPPKHQSTLRIMILSTALLFILLGVMNGGAYDVLIKAINICTECIGLG